MHRWKNQSANRIVPVVVLILSLFAQFAPSHASAAQFTQAYIRLDRMEASTATGGTICAKPATVATEGQVVVTFPATYTVNGTAANWTVTTTGIPVGSTAWISPTTATNVTGQAVTFGSGDLTVGTLYCFNFTGVSTLTTASSAASSQQASIETQTSGSATIDHTDLALANITNDQILVTAVVPPTFIFVLSGNTDNFGGNLDPASIKSTSGRSITVTTNAKGGWIAWAKDSNAGLASVAASYTIPTATTGGAGPSTLVAGTEGYVLQVVKGFNSTGCTSSVDAEYHGVGTDDGGTLATAYQEIATCTGGSPATANADVMTLSERVAISGATPAASDYSDIITVVGAGNF